MHKTYGLLAVLVVFAATDALAQNRTTARSANVITEDQLAVDPYSAESIGLGEDGCGCEAYDSCNECGGCRKGHKHNKKRDAWFSCNCNGSYKFPVPPLYTYHWPGRYSHQLMTNYHSPWRFPALKPYTDEAPLPAITGRKKIRQASAEIELPSNDTNESLGVEPLSAKIRRYYGN